ncbi:MAG TPA: Clp protease N-terminal domain-containing protein [Ktedonobacterales bacterium]|jgi:hypothetical protein
MNDRDRFDRFTERARKVLSLAQEEAQRFNHNYIGTEHLLLGLVREGEGVAARVLAELGVELQAVRQKVEEIIGRGDRIVLGEIGLTPRAKKVIELAVDEARRLNHHFIGTEHLLLGLMREGEGVAAGVLESLGVNLEKVRTQTILVLSRASGRHQTRASSGGFSVASSTTGSVAGRSSAAPPYKPLHLTAEQPARAWVAGHAPADGSQGCVLGQIIVGTSGNFTLTLYNGMEEDAPIISIIHRPPSGATFPFHCLVERGLAYSLEGTPGSVTIFYAELTG